MKFIIIRECSGLLSLKKQWDTLITSRSDISITQTWEWMSSWWQVYGKDRELFIICGYLNGQLVGILPLSRLKKGGISERVRFRTFHLLGSGKTGKRGVVSDYLDMIVREGDEISFILGLLSFLEKNREWDEIILENVSENSIPLNVLKEYFSERFFSMSEIKRSPSPLIKLPRTWEDFLKSISSSLRYKIRRGRKEFENLGGEFKTLEKQRELFQGFQDIKMLHQLRWNSRGEPGAFSSTSWQVFHKMVISRVFNRNWLSMSFLYIKGKPFAANYSFTINNRVHFFQSGLKTHPNNKVRPGLLLHSYCIEDAIKKGYREYDFLSIGKSGAGYKLLWTDYSRELLTIRLSRKGNKENVYRALGHLRSRLGALKTRISKALSN